MYKCGNLVCKLSTNLLNAQQLANVLRKCSSLEKKKTYENTTPAAQRCNINAELQEAGVNTQVTPADLTRSEDRIMGQITC